MNNLPVEIQRVIYQYLDANESQMRLSTANKDWFHKKMRTWNKKQSAYKDFRAVMGFPQNPIDYTFKDAEMYLTPNADEYSCSNLKELMSIFQMISDDLLKSKNIVTHTLIGPFKLSKRFSLIVPYMIHSTTLYEPVYIHLGRETYIHSAYRLRRPKIRRMQMSMNVKALIY